MLHAFYCIQVHVHANIFYYFQVQLIKGKKCFPAAVMTHFKKQDMILLNYNMACFAPCL